MSQALQIQLSDAAYAALEHSARAAAKSPEELAAAALEQHFGNASAHGVQRGASDARKRFERHFGAVRLGHATGADNEGIDADLARTYADGHEES